MNIMAFRSLAQINRNVLQNSRRLFSYRFEMSPRLDEGEVHQKAASDEVPADLKIGGSFRYNVCHGRTSPVERPSTVGDIVATQRQHVKAAIEEQHLQPAMLPEYYQKQMDRNALINPQPEPNEEDRINKGHRNVNQFQVSKTYANAILPLKAVKLANPFPEPVKMMMSRTVSDEEKAEQMLAEARSQKTFNERGRMQSAHQSRSFTTMATRCYSTVGRDADKCKKLDGAKKGCSKMKLANCPAPQRTKCERLAKQIDCKKQQAPYPAYSEFCHEDIEAKPSECKICPWKPEENPNFKAPKKHMHTSAQRMMRRTGLEFDLLQETSECLTTTEPILQEEEFFEPQMECDARKPPCEKPKNLRCPPPKKKLIPEIKKKPKKEKKCENDQQLEQLLTPRREEILQQSINLANQKGEGTKKGGCKIPKFKFPKCEWPTRSDQFSGRCPTKKKKPFADCPPENKCDGDMIPVKEYLLEKRKNDKTKCPRIDMTVYKDESDDDPCRLKRKGTTKICPGDLLKKKKKRPRKKTSANVIPHAEKHLDPPQPSTRVT